MDGSAIVPVEWPILVTGASGFLGGHIARELARAGHPVRGLTRRPPRQEPDDPPIDWVFGDLREPATRQKALVNIRGVIHSASWVSLGIDARRDGVAINVGATRGLLADAIEAGVERFVYSSTLHTLAAGTAMEPADECSIWNLSKVDSAYARTKREAEAIVLDGLGGKLPGVAFCPGMILGPRDPKPTSTSLLLLMARSPVAFLPGGGIPVIDARVAAMAHRLALGRGEPGSRYALVGPYLRFADMARIVGCLTGWPRWVMPLPAFCERPLSWSAGQIDRWTGGRWLEVSEAAVAGGFLALHVRGDRADSLFGLEHPAPIDSIRDALVDARRTGLAPWLRIRGAIGPTSSRS